MHYLGLPVCHDRCQAVLRMKTTISQEIMRVANDEFSRPVFFILDQYNTLNATDNYYLLCFYL